MNRRQLVIEIGLSVVPRIFHPRWPEIRLKHPAPRDGITSAAVLTGQRLSDTPSAIPTFNIVRKIPAVVDGVACYCDCAARLQLYSLLSCFEDHGMAATCGTCLAEARLVYSLHLKGASLAAIRDAVDAHFAWS